MQRQTITENGRKYEALIEGENRIILGPPEGLVDELGLPEPMATRLHNVLHARGLLTYDDVRKRSGELLGVWQEVLMTDVQVLYQTFQNFQNDGKLNGGHNG